MARKLNRDEILTLLEHLYNIIQSGLPLDTALLEFARESKGRLKSYAEKMASQLQQGVSLSETFADQKLGINRYILTMIQIGEKGGNLSEVLADVIKFYRHHLHTQRQIISATRYPSMVLGISLLFIIFMIMFILPQLREVYKLIGKSELPALTNLFITIGYYIKKYIILDIIIVAILITLITNFWTLSVFKQLRSHLELAIPIFGQMIYYNNIGIFSRALAHLLKRKIPLPNALVLAKLTLRNTTFHSPLDRVTVEVEKGKKLSTALAEIHLFPPGYVWAIQTSENRGDLDFVLTELANLYDDKFDNLSQTVQAYLEPLLLIFIGTFLGIIIYSFYHPLFTIPKILGKE